MLSNSGERWLISITDMPEPRQSSSSSRMRSRTASGRALGPALKLWTRYGGVAVARVSGLELTNPETVEDDTMGSSFLRRPVANRSGASHRDCTLPSAIQNNMAPLVRAAPRDCAKHQRKAGVESHREKNKP